MKLCVHYSGAAVDLIRSGQVEADSDVLPDSI